MVSKNYLKYRTLFFIMVSALMFLLFYKVPLIGDDVYNLQHREMFNTVQKSFNYVVSQYGNWSSRTIINFFMYLFSTHNIIYFSFITALLFYVLLGSLSKIFNSENSIYVDICLCLLVLLTPFPYFSTAGWIATTTTYLWPIIAAIYAVIPLLVDQQMKWYQYILTSLAVIYATNNEQIMIVLLIVYITNIMIRTLKHKVNFNYKYSCLQLIFILLNFVYFILCPGNRVRSQLETAKWFPEFSKLNMINKLDIGFMTTGEHVLFSNSLLVMLLTLLIFWAHILISKKHILISGANLGLLLVADILFDVFILTGHFRSLFNFPKLGLLNQTTITSIVQFLVYCCYIILLALTYYYGQNSYSYIEMISLLGGALLARIALGFSPTSYVSATRTFAVLGFTFLIMCIPLVKNILSKNRKVLIVLSVFAIINMSIFILQIKGIELNRFLPLWTNIW